MEQQWINACRPGRIVLAVMLFIASYRLAGIPSSWIVLIAVVWITLATMLQNDWRDREHDKCKGKTVAGEYTNTFLALTLVCWSLAIMTTVVVIARHDPVGAVLVLGIIIGLVYSETRRIPFVPMILVALCSALPTLISLLVRSPWGPLWFFVAVFSVILAREIITDQVDMDIDCGYKRTLPLVIGKTNSNYVVALLLCVSAIAYTMVSIYLMTVVMPLAAGAVLAVSGASTGRVRCQIDLGIVLTTLLIIVIT